MPSKVERVRSLFEIPEKYLVGRQFDIKIRTETVQDFTRDRIIDHVLDIGCGDGSISLPLLPRTRHLTLLDVSANMLELSRNRVPSSRERDVTFINKSFIDAKLPAASFDLVLCIGVLAHVDSPAGLIAEIARIAKPNAHIVLEFTDSFHFWSAPVVLYQNLLKLVRPAPYSLNRLRRKQVMRLWREHGFKAAASYRYGLPLMGTHKVANQSQMYKMTRYLFGTPTANRNRWMGNEYLYLLSKGD